MQKRNDYVRWLNVWLVIVLNKFVNLIFSNNLLPRGSRIFDVFLLVVGFAAFLRLSKIVCRLKHRQYTVVYSLSA